MRGRNRSDNVRLTFYGLLLAAMLTGFGCGGGGGSPQLGEIAGIVFDVNGNPVRNAKVYLASNVNVTASSNSAGSYALLNVPIGQQLVRATATQDGVAYSGSNVGQVFVSERTKSVNVTVGKTSDLASIHGTITDRAGNAIQNAHVFAIAGTLSSSLSITDARGFYRMDSLLAGAAYTIQASGLSFDGDNTTATLAIGEDRQLNFVLSGASNPNLPVPLNPAVTAWTSPASTRTAHDRSAIDNVKRLVNPKYETARRAHSRTTTLGNFIEVDFTWDPVVSNSLLGYGIYRATGNAALAAIDFLNDPLAQFYADNDDRLLQNHQYSYAVTSLNTGYPNATGSESAQTTPITVTTLGDMLVNSVTAGPTFNWQSQSGAASYVVFVFDRYPSLGVDSLWNNMNMPTSGSSVAYGGPQLLSGQTYYYIVLGIGAAPNSKTISAVQSFVAN